MTVGNFWVGGGADGTSSLYTSMRKIEQSLSNNYEL